MFSPDSNDAGIGFCSLCKRHVPLKRMFCPSDGHQILPIPAGEPTIGATFANRYQLLSELGSGGMAKVFRAVDLVSHDLTALKILNTALVSQGDLVESFYREARILKEINHDNIVGIIDYGHTPDGYVYIALEVLHGACLYDFMRRQEVLPLHAALAVILQLAEALAAIHIHGIVHNDLKPENIYLVPEADELRVKILDFGIADETWIDSGADKQESVAGTPAYMCPEAIKGEQTDSRSDLYTVGLILYELISGELPFDEADPIRTCARQLVEIPPAPSTLMPEGYIPPALDELVMRLLEKDPERRFADDRAFIDALKALMPKAPSDDDAEWLEEEVIQFMERSDEQDSTSPHNILSVPKSLASTRGTELANDTPSSYSIPQSSFSFVLVLHLSVVPLPNHPLLDRGFVSFLMEPILERLKRIAKGQQLAYHEESDGEYRILKMVTDGDPIGAGVELTELARSVKASLVKLHAQSGAPFTMRIALEAGPAYHHREIKAPVWELVRGAGPDVTWRLAKHGPEQGVIVGPTLYTYIRESFSLSRWDYMRIREYPIPVPFYFIDEEGRDDVVWKRRSTWK